MSILSVEKVTHKWPNGQWNTLFHQLSFKSFKLSNLNALVVDLFPQFFFFLIYKLIVNRTMRMHISYLSSVNFASFSSLFEIG